MHGLVAKPIRNDPSIELIAKRGLEHERRYLEDLRADGRRIVEIEKDGLGGRAAHARRPTARRRSRRRGTPAPSCARPPPRRSRAMRGGADVVYQATFFDGTWRGHADFLLRRDHEPGEPDSAFGAWHYEVADTKLARHVKASAILQICSYVEQLTAIQGRQPEHLYVVLGGSARPTDRCRVDDFMAYYRRVKRGVRDRGRAPRGRRRRPPAYPPIGTYPEPVEHCDVCRWAPSVPGPAPRGRRPEPRGGRRQRASGSALKARGRRRRDAASPASSCRWRRRSRASGARGAGARPRAGPDPGRRRRTPAGSCGSCCRSTGARTASRSRCAGSSACRSPARETCSWTSRVTRSRSTTAWTTCSGSWSRASRRTTSAGPRPGGEPDAEVPRDLEPGRGRPRHLGGREGRVRARRWT